MGYLFWSAQLLLLKTPLRGAWNIENIIYLTGRSKDG